MYKTKLQELCQQKHWSLPEYNTGKYGLDHCPRYQATVTVNGLSFKAENLCKSSKEAQNSAAELAFLHFSQASGSSSSNNLGSNLLAGGTSQQLVQEVNKTDGTGVVVKSQRIGDGRHLYKNQLQIYAQKRNLSLPEYTCQREGPPHACRFKCKVTVHGQTFESMEYFPTLKEAENAAAEAALLSLSPEGIHEDDSAFYKNLLQELAQKGGYLLPAYETGKSGDAHAPTFVSTVEIGGKVFTGVEAKTKKQAEMSAAKVAYMELKEGESSQSPTFALPASQKQEAPELSFSASLQDFSSLPQPILKPAAPEITTSSVKPEEQAEDDEGNVSITIDPAPVPSSGENDGYSSSDFEDSAPTRVTTLAPPTRRYPIHVVVRPRLPNMKFPPNSIVKYSDDGRWVSIKMSYPSPEDVALAYSGGVQD